MSYFFVWSNQFFRICERNEFQNFLSLFLTVTIWIPNKSGIQMVQTCLVYEWWSENRKMSVLRSDHLIRWTIRKPDKFLNSEMFRFQKFGIQMVAVLIYGGDLKSWLVPILKSEFWIFRISNGWDHSYS